MIGVEKLFITKSNKLSKTHQYDLTPPHTLLRKSFTNKNLYIKDEEKT